MKHKGILALVITVFVIFFITGCPLGVDVSGNWDGTVTINSTDYDFSMDLDQDGTDVTGEAEIGYEGTPIYTLDVDATLDGNTLEGDMTSNDAAYTDVDSFEGEVDGDTMEGDMDLANGFSGSFSLER